MDILQKSNSDKSEGRKDGRAKNELRPMEVDQAILDRADGSARLSQGKSSVMVAVHGPMEVKQRKELIDKATLEVIYKPKSGIAGPKEKELEFTLRSTIENVVMTALHPRTAITITVQVLSEDGSMFSTALNGICLALEDAGIPMKDQIASCTCAVTKDGSLLIDPTEAEETKSPSHLVFAFNGTQNGIVTSKSIGIFTEESYFLALDASKKACEKIFTFYKATTQKRSK